jgi:methionyl-tRNA synthetase
MRSRQYVTTAIDYPNAPKPHMGQVLEKVLADTVVRWFRLRGDEVRFQIGTDEHGVKIQRTAEKEKLTPKELVDRNVPAYIELYRRIGISYDEPDGFIRTTDQKRHWPTVVELWKRLQKAGMLERRTYTGLYCQGCERFLTKRDIVDGKCPIHNSVPEEVSEDNWFFLLSKESKWLKELLTREGKDGYKIIPGSRAHETLSLIEQGLEDVSFSRPKSSLSWGIPVPDDPDQTMYVWCDALTNYISGLGYFTKNENRKFWDDAEVTHVIGKDIARFHALIWPAMLKHAGVRTPDRLLIHGFLTNEGQKMSKTIGNVVDPETVLKRFGENPDPLRFYLSHEIPVGNDGDFSWKRIEELYDSKLRNQLGNLLNRVLVLLKKEGDFSVPSSAEDAKRAGDGWKKFSNSMDAFELHLGIQQAMELVDSLNIGIDRMKPWTLKGKEKVDVLSRFAESLRHSALLLLPFMPKTAQEISRQLNVPYAEKMLERDFVITPELREWGSQKDWKTVGEPKILFPPLEK